MTHAMDGGGRDRGGRIPRPWRAHGLLPVVLSFALAAAGPLGCAVDRDLPPAPGHLTSAGGLDHDALMDLARRMEARGDPLSALRFYRQAAALAPRDAAAWQEVLRLAFLLGDERLARAAFDRARALAPQAPGVLVAEARFLVLDDRPSAARAVLARVPTQARDAGYYRTLGLSFDLEGAHGRAREAYARGLEAAPDDAGLMVDLALSLALDGNYPAANDILRRLADRPGTEGLARANLALVAALGGDPALARRLAGGRAGRADPRFYELLARLKGAERARVLILGPSSVKREGAAARPATDGKPESVSPEDSAVPGSAPYVPARPRPAPNQGQGDGDG